MSREEFKSDCIVAVKKINSTADKTGREKLFGEFCKRLHDEGYDGDYMEYDGDTITNIYLNFDSNCGLSLIEASEELDELLSDIDAEDIGENFSLSDMISILSDHGERNEYWDDLVYDGGEEEYCFTRTEDDEIEDMVESILNIKNDWVGEEEFDKKIQEMFFL